MSARAIEDQIHDLARDLEPVRPIPRLRSALVAAIALGLAALGTHWILGGPGPRAGGSEVWSVAYLLTFAGLALTAIGALGAALATSVPGREDTARYGVHAAMGGAVLAVLGGAWGVLVVADGSNHAEGITECLDCIGRAVALGAAPVLITCAFIVYAAVRRPTRGTALALAGGVALGAAAVHVTCPIDDPIHWLVGHTFAPVLAVLVLTGPAAALLVRAARRV